MLNVLLNCQIRIEPARRSYAAPEHELLSDLFGNAGALGPDPAKLSLDARKHSHSGFCARMCGSSFRSRAASTSISRRPNISTASKSGEVPLNFLFSGSVFYRDVEGDVADRPDRMDQGECLSAAGAGVAFDDGPLLSADGLAVPASRRFRRALSLQARQGPAELRASAWRPARCQTGGLANMKLDRIRDVANAVLYEGYILYPYRPSSIKNRQRWTFGCVFPKPFAGRQGDFATMQTQLLLRGGTKSDARHAYSFSAGPDPRGRIAAAAGRRTCAGNRGGSVMVPRLEIDGKEYLAWEEAIERESCHRRTWPRGHRRAPRQRPFHFQPTRTRDLSRIPKAKSAVS